GAKLVLTHGLTVRPFSTAFFAKRPAPSITLGFEVFVQLVMAAITTAPWPRSNSPRSSDTGTLLVIAFCAFSSSVLGAASASPMYALAACSSPSTFDASAPTRVRRQLRLASVSATRSCGRLGPAIDGTTVL